MIIAVLVFAIVAGTDSFMYNKVKTSILQHTERDIEEMGSLLESHISEQKDQNALSKFFDDDRSTYLFSMDGKLLFSSDHKQRVLSASEINEVLNDGSISQNVDGSIVSATTVRLDKYNRGILVKTYEDTHLDYVFYNYIVSIVITLVIVTMGAVVFILTNRSYNKDLAQQDIIHSELKKARDKAEEESQQKLRFLANVSHELRTPLNAIIGFSDIMIKETHGTIENEKYQEHLKDINDAGQHLLGLIGDLLDLSKATEDKLTVDSKPLDLNKIAQVSVRMMSNRAEESGLEIIKDLPKKHCTILGDHKRMQQVMLNLLSNAVKFTNTGGKVTIKAYNEDSTINLIVMDTGAGIKQEQIARVLAPFGQADNDKDRKHQGTGLGLPLTKKLVELMGGKFNIESEEGLGTSIMMQFQHHDLTQQSSSNIF